MLRVLGESRVGRLPAGSVERCLCACSPAVSGARVSDRHLCDSLSLRLLQAEIQIQRLSAARRGYLLRVSELFITFSSK